MTTSTFDTVSSLSAASEFGGTNSVLESRSNSTLIQSSAYNRSEPAPASAPIPARNTIGASIANQKASASSTSTNIAKDTKSLPVAITGMRKWSGKITAVEGDIFTAELTPLDHEGPIVLADFEIADLDADDLASVRIGDLFYLNVRTIRDRGRRVTRTSNLLLRRLGHWSREEIRESEEEGRDDFNAIRNYVQ